MTALKLMVSFVCVCFAITTECSQPRNKNIDDLKGYINLTVDISTLKDTAGIFEITIGGAIPKLERKGNKLTVRYYMDEPRSASLLFYPRDTIKKYPGKALNSIAVKFSDYYLFLAQPGSTRLVTGNDIHNSKLTNATQPQYDFDDLVNKKQAIASKVEQENSLLINQFKAADNKRTKDSLMAIFFKKYNVAIDKFNNETILDYIAHHPDSPTALHHLEEYSYMGDLDMNALASLYNQFTDRIKALPTARRIHNQIDNDRFYKTNLVGKAAPQFISQDTLGKPVSLKDFTGHVTLLQFWASWCGPCRTHNPELVQAYQKFKAKGFKILAVSLDFKKDKWMEAIHQDGLTWAHVSELKGFDGKISNQYHLFGIPGNYLINEKGIVLAKDLEGGQLDVYLAKLFP